MILSSSYPRHNHESPFRNPTGDFKVKHKKEATKVTPVFAYFALYPDETNLTHNNFKPFVESTNHCDCVNCGFEMLTCSPDLPPSVWIVIVDFFLFPVSQDHQ